MPAQYEPASTGAVIWAASAGMAFTAAVRVHPVAPARTPRPRPNGMVGGPSLTSVMLTVPACETVNVRNAVPWAVSVLAKVSVVGDTGVGAAGGVVLLLPHAALSNARATAATTALGYKPPCLTTSSILENSGWPYKSHTIRRHEGPLRNAREACRIVRIPRAFVPWDGR